MTLADMAQVAVPIIGQRNEAAQVVVCQSCDHVSDQLTIASNAYACPNCESDICIMCGCTSRFACLGGCDWLSPGICTSHRDELQEMAREVFGETK